MRFYWARPGGNVVTGPASFAWSRWENPGLTTGASVHLVDFRSSKSARYMAMDLINASDQMLTMMFSEMRRLQVAAGQTPMVCFVYNCGLNDVGDTEDSVGPSPAASNTAAGFADNWTAIRDRIKEIWDVNAWDWAEVYHWLQVSHSAGYAANPYDAAMATYRTAAAGLAATWDNAFAVDLSAAASYATMRANGWFSGATEASASRVHLSVTGYSQMMFCVVAAMQEESQVAADNAEFGPSRSHSFGNAWRGL